MSKMQWFRLYSRIIDDEKLRLLAFEDRWHFVALCCLKSDGLLDEPDTELRNRRIAVKLGVQVRELEEIGRRLREVALVDESLNPIAWEDLQYKSDNSSARVKAYRERQQKQSGNDMERPCNVSETAQETEQNRTEDPPTPRKRGNDGKTLIAEDWVAPAVADLPPKARACAEQWTAESYETHAEAFHGYWRSERKKKADWRATWANRVIGLHSQVMRDQKFGNAPPAKPSVNDGKPKSPQEWLAYCEERATHFRSIGPRGLTFAREWDERASQARSKIGIVVPNLRATA